MHALGHIDTWIFDLDHTLYPPEARLFDQIEIRMTDWIMGELGVTRSEADRLRHDYWARYGTTLAGLMAEHGMAPDGYLTHVHDISIDHLAPSPELARAIARLPGRRIVYTNGTSSYAERLLAALELRDPFHAVYGIEEANLRSKPDAGAFHAIIARDGIDPARAAMIEDTPANLRVPHALGMATILVAPRPVEGDHLHHHTPDLTAFLSQIGRDPFPARD